MMAMEVGLVLVVFGSQMDRVRHCGKAATYTPE